MKNIERLHKGLIEALGFARVMGFDEMAKQLEDHIKQVEKRKLGVE